MKPQIRRGTFGRWTVHEPDGTAQPMPRPAGHIYNLAKEQE